MTEIIFHHGFFKGMENYSHSRVVISVENNDEILLKLKQQINIICMYHKQLIGLLIKDWVKYIYNKKTYILTKRYRLLSTI